MQIPEQIKQYILNQCRTGKGIVTIQKQGMATGQLEFDVNGMSKTIEKQIFIISYIERLLTYSRKNCIILFNGEELGMLNIPKLLEYKPDAE